MKVTIIIPCYNAEQWISESIQSALAQTYQNIEIIFVDNESLDNSYQIAKEMQRDGQDFKVLTTPNLYKHSWEEPVNKALNEATGEYFTILGADDYIQSDYVDNIVKIISAAPDKIKILQTPIIGVRGAQEEFLGETKHIYTNLDDFKKLLFQRCPVNTPSMVYKKELYDKGIVRWNSKEYLGAADYDLYFNIADKGLFIYPYPKWIGYFYRWHSTQSTWGMQRDFSQIDVKIKQYWKERWAHE